MSAAERLPEITDEVYAVNLELSGPALAQIKELAGYFGVPIEQLLQYGSFVLAQLMHYEQQKGAELRLKIGPNNSRDNFNKYLSPRPAEYFAVPDGTDA